MTDVLAMINRLRSLSIATRNKRHPFELGNVRTQDRFQAAAKVRHCGQGELLNPESILDTGLLIPGGVSPGIGAAALAFRGVQRFFESAAVEQRLAPWAVLGFMSDSLRPNGLAAVLHDGDESVHFINVTAGAFFHTLCSAYHIVSDARFEPSLPRPGEFIEADATRLVGIMIQVPLSPERRTLAMKFAVAAFRITFFHELAHILRGHTAFLRRSLGAASDAIMEADVHPTVAVEAVDLRRRALETDADDFSGRFMAQQFFKGFRKEELTFEAPRFRAKAFEVVVGVVLMYSWFSETEEYHSGSLRAYVVLGSMFMELGLNVKISANWVSERISGLQHLMIERGLPSHSTGLISESKLQDLNEQTLAYREANMRDWLQCRPWGYEGSHPQQL